MKRYCIRDRKRYKREQLDTLCVKCKFEKCHLWAEYNGEEDEEIVLPEIGEC